MSKHYCVPPGSRAQPCRARAADPGGVAVDVEQRRPRRAARPAPARRRGSGRPWSRRPARAGRSARRGAGDAGSRAAARPSGRRTPRRRARPRGRRPRLAAGAAASARPQKATVRPASPAASSGLAVDDRGRAGVGCGDGTDAQRAAAAYGLEAAAEARPCRRRRRAPPAARAPRRAGARPAPLRPSPRAAGRAGRARAGRAARRRARRRRRQQVARRGRPDHALARRGGDRVQHVPFGRRLLRRRRERLGERAGSAPRAVAGPRGAGRCARRQARRW